MAGRHRHRRHRWLALASMLLAGSVTACSGSAASTPKPELNAEPTESVQLRTFEELWQTVNDNYVYEDFLGVDWNAVHDTYAQQITSDLSPEEYDALLNAMIAELPDGLVTWQTRSQRLEADLQSTTGYEGIGSYVGVRSAPDPRVVLLAVIDGSPAEQAGLHPHDSILSIDGTPVEPDEGLDVVQRIRGPAGSQVELTVRSPGEDPREVMVDRASLPFAAITLQPEVIGDDSVGYILFPPAPYDDLSNQMLDVLQTLSEQRQIGALVLDMRVATAASGWPLGLLMSLFGDGDMGTVHSRSEVQPLTVKGEDIYSSQEIPLAIIVGPDTNGAIEIFAAAMQARGRAVVVGMPTPGDIEVMSEYLLPDGSRALIPTQSYLTPDGVDVGLNGVQPDVAVDLDWDAVTASDDPVRDTAVSALSG